MPDTLRCRMQYELVLGRWNVDVTRDGRLVRHIKFADGEKVAEMATRGEPFGIPKTAICSNTASSKATAAVDLLLSPDQFAKLKR